MISAACAGTASSPTRRSAGRPTPTTRAATSRRKATRSRPGPEAAALSLDGPASPSEQLAEAFALIALELHGAVARAATGGACLLQFLEQRVEKRAVFRQAVHD